MSAGHRRLAALIGALLAVAALTAGLLVAAGRGAAAADRPPATATLGLVPARALVAVHVATDRGRDAAARAGTLLRRLPSWPRLQASILQRLDAPGCGIDMRRDPGHEAVFALLPGSGGVSSPLLVTDAPANGISASAPQPCGALVVRRIGGLTVIGEPTGVLAAQALHEGRGTSLAASPVYRRAAAGLPDSRVADAWVSPQGARRLLAPLGGALGTVGALLDTPGLKGAAAALVPGRDRARITVRRVSNTAGGAPAFTATLQRRAPADTLAYVASGDLAGALQRLIVLAGSSVGARLPQLLKQGGTSLATLGNVGRESAVVIAPGESGPTLTLLSHVTDPQRARTAMTALEPALAHLVGAPAGTSFADATPGGKPARTLTGAAGTPLTWAIDGDTLIVATSSGAVADARASGGRLIDTPGYRAVAGNVPNPIRSLVFLDPKQLLQLSTQSGIGPGSALQSVRDDLDRIRAIGAYGAGTGNVSTVELSLSIP